MRLRTGFDTTQRQVFHREVDLKKSRFRISRRALLKISLGMSAFLLSAGVAFYFEQYPQMWMALGFGVLISAWQVLFYGFASSPKDETSLKVTNFYSKGTLIFLAIFWTVLISAVSIALYLKFPKS